MKHWRAVVLSLGALLLLAVARVAGGNALASRRERAATREWEATFGSYQALIRKYTVAESNASARRVEEITREIGFDVGLQEGRPYQAGPLAEADRMAFREYADGELSLTSGVPRPAPPRVAELLASRRAALLTLEEFLSSASPPRWAFDGSGSPDDRPRMGLGAHHQLHRLLIAKALDSCSRGDEAEAARALEASWILNQSIAARPEIVSQIITTANSRLEVGALRRIGGSARVWMARLDEMGSRGRLVEALLLDQGDVREFRVRLRRLMAKERSGRAAATAPFQEIRERLWGVEYSRGWVRAIARLRDAPAFEAPKAVAPKTDPAVEIPLAIAISNLANSFDRADRLALDAELTEKVLRLRERRNAQRAWPEPSNEVASSRFPGLSWNYRVDGDGMTISLNRDLPNPYPNKSLALPITFTATSPRR